MTTKAIQTKNRVRNGPDVHWKPFIFGGIASCTAEICKVSFLFY